MASSGPRKSRRALAERGSLRERLTALERIAIDVAIEAQDAIELGDFPGSALRGGWFAALKDLGCVVEHRECDACSLVESCAIPALLGATDPETRFFARPFRLRVGSELTMPTVGGRARFGVDLFGKSIAYAALAKAGIERLGERGLGRRRGRFRVESIEVRDEVTLRREFVARLGALPQDRLVVRFETPLRLLEQGRPLREFSFTSLVSNLLRRASGLVESWAEPDPRELVSTARSIAVVEARIRRADRVRFSSRQERAMNLMGHVGEIEIAGDLAPFLPLLAFGEAVGAGKGTAFGLGNIRLLAAGEGGAA